MAYQPQTYGVVSTVNSTSANLAGAAVFTGTSEDVLAYSGVVVSVFSSHASATDGLSIQQSSNGTNWDLLDTYSIPATTGKAFKVPIQAQYFRVVYTNGATLTTSLRIQCIFHTNHKRGSSVRPQDARTNDNDMEEVIGYNMLFNGTTWDRARGDTTFGIDVDVTRLPALNVGSAPATSGGLTTYHLVSAATTNATVVKNTPGQLYGWYIYNSNATPRKIAFHNTTSTPTAGASIFFTLVIPGTSGANVEMSNGIAFSTGIAITTVTDLTDAGTTAVGLNDLNINLFYK